MQTLTNVMPAHTQMFLQTRLQKTMLVFVTKIAEKVQTGTIQSAMMELETMETDVIKIVKLRMGLCVGTNKVVIFVNEKGQSSQL